MWYKIDLTKLLVQLLPPILRSKFLVSLLTILTLPIRHILELLYVQYETVRKRLDTTVNVIRLEKALNDAFYLKDNQIRIESIEDKSQHYWYQKAENQPTDYMYLKYEHGVVIKRKGESSYKENFVLWIPTFLCSSIDSTEDKYGGKNIKEIKRLLNIYKPAGRVYRIELYDYE